MTPAIPPKALRNGAIGAITALALLLAAVLVPQLAFRARTQEHVAEFANAAGLTTGTPVTVAGVPAGRVTGVELAGDRVLVTFRVDSGQRLGSATRAGIKIRTVLGTRYLQVDPAGPGELEDPIPVARTAVPYSLDEISRGATATTAGLDTAALQRMIATLRQAAPTDSRLTGDALTGIGDAARVLGERGEQIDELLRGTQALTSTLLEEQDSLVSLLGDARLVADVLHQRRDVLRQLIADLDGVTAQLDGLLRDNRDVLGPLLEDLHAVTDSLERSDADIAETLRQLGPASRYVTNASGTGPWGEVAAPLGPIPDNVLCVAGLLEGCR
ncbi:MCE family protein [Saccharopolyspora flava]|uniref:Phospholipid/cholesterol/gamma-HCH transport system substrate-binding protein n=1 Tax=Saccharopolyspora flava TaxID=95161 RepID=A0A1I6SC14_9PSEU|nr:MCE family protein [Saccharopolyspora flava]SFS74477.1 phospholipid/cholesterol/gamma-HCH transport system substrate-binding protein [Saccharopolyspora flava]